MAFFDVFKKFAFKGNVVDLAVGVVIGGAFGRIVSAVVDDVVMPLVSLFMPNGNWRGAGIVRGTSRALSPIPCCATATCWARVLDFFIISLVLFLLVKRILRAAEAHLLHTQNTESPTQKNVSCLPGESAPGSQPPPGLHRHPRGSGARSKRLKCLKHRQLRGPVVLQTASSERTIG